MQHARVLRTTSIRRAVGASALGALIGAGALLAPPASAEPTSEPGPVIISFYDFPADGGSAPDLAFFRWPEGREGGPLGGRLLSAGGALKAPAVEVLSYDPGTVNVESIAPGDVAELYDVESGVVIGRAVYDGKPGLAAPTCAGATTATGSRTVGEPIQNVEAFTPVPGAQSSGDVKINPSTLAEQAADGSTWSATFERPVATGDFVSVYASAMRDGVYVQSVVQRPVITCPAPAAPAVPAPAPAVPAQAPADTTAPVGSSAPVKAAKKAKLAGLVKTGLAFTVTAQETATLKATLTLRTTTGKGKKKKVKELVVGSLAQTVPAGATATVKLKAEKKFASRLKKAAKQSGSKLVTTITLTDAAGNVTTLPTSTISVPKS